MIAPPQYLQSQIDRLFRAQLEEPLGDSLRHVAEYFDFLADCLRPDELADAVKDHRVLFSPFEAVTLWLQNALLGHGDGARQIGEILGKQDYGRLFAILTDISPRDAYQLMHRRASFAALLSLNAFGRNGRSSGDEPLLTPKQLYEARLGLRRAAQTLRYLATLDSIPEEETIGQLKEHYDPDLIDRHRVLALLHLLRSQLSALPEDSPAHQLTSQIDAIEKELGRPRIRWKRVIAGAFVVFAFLADLKSISPATYGRLSDTATAVLQVLQAASPSFPALPPAAQAVPGPDDIALPQAPPEPEDEDA